MLEEVMLWDILKKTLSINPTVSSQQKVHYARSKNETFALLSQNIVEKFGHFLFLSTSDEYGNLPFR